MIPSTPTHVHTMEHGQWAITYKERAKNRDTLDYCPQGQLGPTKTERAEGNFHSINVMTTSQEKKKSDNT